MAATLGTAAVVEKMCAYLRIDAKSKKICFGAIARALAPHIHNDPKIISFALSATPLKRKSQFEFGFGFDFTPVCPISNQDRE